MTGIVLLVLVAPGSKVASAVVFTGIAGNVFIIHKQEIHSDAVHIIMGFQLELTYKYYNASYTLTDIVI
ncbi:hypothetical protein [Mucilaginibacter sp.]|uniref:hypothetical protein n=1 Tax=Mucilaginibacter sp. TaxID=1882438 RepID=UPI003263EC02